MPLATPSAIEDLLAAQGAVGGGHHGRKVVLHFGDADREARAAREGAILLDRNDRAPLTIAGPDARRFLHGMVTNEVQGLGEGSGNYSCHLNAQGQIIADFHLWAMPDHFLVETDASRAIRLRESLERYIIADQVEVADLSPSLCSLALHGPNAPAQLAEACGCEPPRLPYQHRWMQFGQTPAMVSRLDETGAPGYRIVCTHANAASVWRHLLEVGQAHGCAPAGFEALNVLRTEAGIPWTNYELTESTLPPEARLESTAISYEKGCYIGQEIIERVRSRGSVHRLLCGFTLDAASPPVAGQEVRSDTGSVGTLTTVVRSPNLEKTIALGYLRREYAAPGTRLRIEDGQAVVTETPFLPLRA